MPDTEIITVREPGATAGGEAIRNLLREQHGQLHPVPELFLYNAARCQLMEEIILPVLNRSAVIIADHYVASSWAYQDVAITDPAITPESVTRTASTRPSAKSVCTPPTAGCIQESPYC